MRLILVNNAHFAAFTVKIKKDDKFKINMRQNASNKGLKIPELIHKTYIL